MFLFFPNPSRTILQIYKQGTSLVVHWLRICLPMQGTWIQSLVWEDSTCQEATEPDSQNYQACVMQLLKPQHPGACAMQQEKPAQEARASQQESSYCLLVTTRKDTHTTTKTQSRQQGQIK